MTGTVAVGIDVGGTKAAGLLVDVSREGMDAVLERRVLETPLASADVVAATVVGLARGFLAERADVVAVGIGAAGLVDRRGVIRFAPNVPWLEYPLKARVEAGLAVAFPIPILLDNDATAAAWGEFRFGAGRGASEMLLVTVGTGIGGGMVSAGRVVRGAHGFSGEIGHIVVEPNGPRCGCGNQGCWEQVASGRAVVRLGRRVARQHPEGTLAAMAGGDPERVTGPMVTDAAARGDRAAAAALAEVGRRLGEGIAGLVNVLDPEVVVVGGGAVAAGELILGPARRAFTEAVEGRSHRPHVPIRAATLGNAAGAVGAADLAVRSAGLR